LVLVVFLVIACPHWTLASTRSIGQKTLLFIRVDFQDAKGDPISQRDAAQIMQKVDAYYREVSYGKLSIETTITPTLRLPRTAAWYVIPRNHSQRDEDAHAAAKAAGFDTANFDLEILTFSSAAGTDGAGTFRGKGVVLAAPFEFGGAIHELGHNFGLPHTDLWKAWDGSVIGAGTPIHYADNYDPMGNGGADPRNHFSVRSKALLGWLGPNGVINVTQSGIYRIYAQDLPGVAEPRGLRIARDAANVYWVEFRQLIVENPYMMNGVRMHRCYADESGQVDMTLNLLDMTPGSPLGCIDAPLLIGRTFSDDESGIYITPLGKGNTVPESVDVKVNIGHYHDNHPPDLRLTASAQTANVGQPVVFHATTGERDGEPLAYSWDFGDGSFAWGNPVVTHVWKETDRDFVIRCAVTDMKGGSAEKSLLMTLGHPLLNHLAGWVAIGDQPLENVRVTTDTTNSVLTDSDGRFVLVNLTSESHTISARKGNFLINPLQVNSPEIQSVRLAAIPLGRDTISSEDGIVLEGDDQLSTPAAFRPPVEITIVAKTSATNLRMAYAADQVIFNWEGNGDELRVDGGPADGRHKAGAGAIPPDTYVTIRWLVTPKRQTIFVNDKLRYKHDGDYSQIDRPVSVFTYESTVTVKLIKVKQLP
jgi:hypothetical protein